MSLTVFLAAWHTDYVAEMAKLFPTSRLIVGPGRNEIGFVSHLKSVRIEVLPHELAHALTKAQAVGWPPLLTLMESELDELTTVLGGPLPIPALVRLQRFRNPQIEAYAQKYFITGNWSRTLFLGPLDTFVTLVTTALPSGRYALPVYSRETLVEIPGDKPVDFRVLEKPLPHPETNSIRIFQDTIAENLSELPDILRTIDGAKALLFRRGAHGRYILARIVDSVGMF